MARSQRRRPGAVAVRRRTDRRTGGQRRCACGTRGRGQPAAITPATRSQLADALSQLAQAIRLPQPQRLQRAAQLAQPLADQRGDDPGAVAVRRLALAIIAAATAAAEVRALVQHGARQTAAPSRRRRPMTVLANAVCSRRHGRRFRSPWPPRWPSSPASWCLPRAGIGR
ncbi:hypothetical protein I552_6842 [Mycobacterium xenopi 3993]|nr:hypothetical protein I552_6842 [Mycobacterium xenopi 3993]